MINVKIGNLFESKATTIVNTVNCVGIMGKGIALDFKNRYPDMFNEYVELCRNNQIKPGEPYIYRDLIGTSIINFPTKDHWKSPSKLSYVVAGLKWFVENYKKLEISSIAFPPLGCGNGGLSWEVVGPIMYKALKGLPIEIEIYAPFGAKQEQLSLGFLDNNCIDNSNEIIGTKSVPFNDRWLLIPYVVKELNAKKYSLKVGRVVFQKICYVLTRSGVNTEFGFKKGSFGPYSASVNQAIAVLSNSNLITQTQNGRMFSIEVAPSFILDKTKYSEAEIIGAEKTIDLFSRIKSTGQAEIIATIIFSADELAKKSKKISELDIYNFVVAWKPQWVDKLGAELSESIRNLAIMRWIHVTPSTDLPHSLEMEI